MMPPPSIPLTPPSISESPIPRVPEPADYDTAWVEAQVGLLVAAASAGDEARVCQVLGDVTIAIPVIAVDLWKHVALCVIGGLSHLFFYSQRTCMSMFQVLHQVLDKPGPINKKAVMDVIFGAVTRKERLMSLSKEPLLPVHLDQQSFSSVQLNQVEVQLGLDFFQLPAFLFLKCQVRDEVVEVVDFTLAILAYDPPAMGPRLCATSDLLEVITPILAMPMYITKIEVWPQVMLNEDDYFGVAEIELADIIREAIPKPVPIKSCKVFWSDGRCSFATPSLSVKKPPTLNLKNLWIKLVQSMEDSLQCKLVKKLFRAAANNMAPLRIYIANPNHGVRSARMARHSQELRSTMSEVQQIFGEAIRASKRQEGHARRSFGSVRSGGASPSDDSFLSMGSRCFSSAISKMTEPSHNHFPLPSDAGSDTESILSDAILWSMQEMDKGEPMSIFDARHDSSINTSTTGRLSIRRDSREGSLRRATPSPVDGSNSSRRGTPPPMGGMEGKPLEGRPRAQSGRSSSPSKAVHQVFMLPPSSPSRSDSIPEPRGRSPSSYNRSDSIPEPRGRSPSSYAASPAPWASPIASPRPRELHPPHNHNHLDEGNLSKISSVASASSMRSISRGGASSRSLSSNFSSVATHIKSGSAVPTPTTVSNAPVSPNARSQSKQVQRSSSKFEFADRASRSSSVPLQPRGVGGTTQVRKTNKSPQRVASAGRMSDVSTTTPRGVRTPVYTPLSPSGKLTGRLNGSTGYRNTRISSRASSMSSTASSISSQRSRSMSSKRYPENDRVNRRASHPSPSPPPPEDPPRPPSSGRRSRGNLGRAQAINTRNTTSNTNRLATSDLAPWEEDNSSRVETTSLSTTIASMTNARPGSVTYDNDSLLHKSSFKPMDRLMLPGKTGSGRRLSMESSDMLQLRKQVEILEEEKEKWLEEREAMRMQELELRAQVSQVLVQEAEARQLAVEAFAEANDIREQVISAGDKGTEADIIKDLRAQLAEALQRAQRAEEHTPSNTSMGENGMRYEELVGERNRLKEENTALRQLVSVYMAKQVGEGGIPGL